MMLKLEREHNTSLTQKESHFHTHPSLTLSDSETVQRHLTHVDL